MSSTQKLILVGYLGRDPEMRTLQSGDSVANASLAVTETWKDKTGQKQERTTWFKLAFWGGLAAIVDNFLEKGSLIYVEGTVEARAFAGKDGSPQASLEVRVREMKMLSSSKKGNGEVRGATAAQNAGAKVALGPGDRDGFEDDKLPW